MNYPFKYETPDQDLIDFAIKYKKTPYPSKGMTFLQFAFVLVKHIKSDYQNPARAKVMMSTDIDHIEKIILNGEYAGHAYSPPVINEKGILNAGHHRKEAHVGAGEDYMWVAICKFDNLQAELDYNLIENEKEDTFKKKVYTNEDCEASLKNMWKEIEGFSENDLKERIGKLQKTKTDKKIILQNCLRELGKKIDAERPLGTALIKTEYRAITGDNLDTTASVSTGDTIVNNSRLLALIPKNLMNGKDLSIGIKIKETFNLDHLNKERKRIGKEVSLDYLYGFCKDFVTKYEDENHKRGNLTLNFPKQYQSDEWKIGAKIK
jgi:hypothetical protein